MLMCLYMFWSVHGSTGQAITGILIVTIGTGSLYTLQMPVRQQGKGREVRGEEMSFKALSTPSLHSLNHLTQPPVLKGWSQLVLQQDTAPCWGYTRGQSCSP